MKKLLLVFILLALVLTGCVVEDSDDIQRKESERLLKEGTQQTGMPNIKHFFERKMMKQILELRDKPDLTTYVYSQALDGKFIYIGRSIGYGLPYSTQYTSPEKYEHNGATLPQADPNGLFSPASTSATWIILVNEETNEQEIVYAEPTMVITQTKLAKRLIAEWSLPENY